MSRFGFRKKNKIFLGCGLNHTRIQKHTITYILPDGKEQVVEVEEAYTPC